MLQKISESPEIRTTSQLDYIGLILSINPLFILVP